MISTKFRVVKISKFPDNQSTEVMFAPEYQTGDQALSIRFPDGLIVLNIAAPVDASYFVNGKYYNVQFTME